MNKYPSKQIHDKILNECILMSGLGLHAYCFIKLGPHCGDDLYCTTSSPAMTFVGWNAYIKFVAHLKKLPDELKNERG